MKNFPISIGFIAAFAISIGTSHAGEELIIKTDQTQLLTVSAAPGAAVVGNPSIADVTVHGTQIFLHGRSYGETNLIILDVDGNQLANFDIVVQNRANNAIALYKAGGRSTFVCAPDCETSLQIGDQTDYFENNSKQTTTKSSLASGSATTTSVAVPPPPPQ